MSKTAQRKRSALQSGYAGDTEVGSSNRKHRFNGSYRLGQYIKRLQIRNAQATGVQA